MIRTLFARGLAALAVLSLACITTTPALAQTAAALTVKDGAGTTQSMGAGSAAGKLFYGFYAAAPDGSVSQPATAAGVAAVVSALGSPLQAGGSVTLAGTPTVNLGALNGAATASSVAAVVTALGTPYQAGGALPLPTGAATAAAQATANGSLASIATATAAGATAAGQASQLAALQQTTPSTAFAAITPSDSTALATSPKALFIGTGGNLTVKGSDGVSATLAVATGQILPIRPTYVMATGTTASGIVALN